MQPQRYDGTFIVIEGADGAGTTTQSERLADELGAFWTKEPADNRIGEKVDAMISQDEYSPEAIALGFAADRMVHLEEEVVPRLADGETVVCDRYYHSSLVYQPVLGADRDWVKELNRAAIRPDLTIVLDVAAEEGMDRVTSRGPDDTIFEELSFQQKVVLGYRELVDELEERIEIVDASMSIDAVYGRIKEVYNGFDDG